MNGSAPNSPATGSHTSVRQKSQPNRRMDAIDSTVSTTPIAKTMPMRIRPKNPVPIRKPESLRDLDLGKGRRLELHDRLRQGRIAQFGAVFLAVGERPFQEVDHRLRLRLVLGVFVQQQPGER